MIEYKYTGDGKGLRLVPEDEWARGVLDEDTLFIHTGPVTPEIVRVYGISPIYATEYIVDKITRKPFGGGKLVFAFKSEAGLDAPANLRRAAGAKSGFSQGGYAYFFVAPKDTVFFAKSGTATTGKEIAFPYVVESSNIWYYMKPSSNELLRWEQAGELEFTIPTDFGEVLVRI